MVINETLLLSVTKNFIYSIPKTKMISKTIFRSDSVQFIEIYIKLEEISVVCVWKSLYKDATAQRVHWKRW